MQTKQMAHGQRGEAEGVLCAVGRWTCRSPVIAVGTQPWDAVCQQREVEEKRETQSERKGTDINRVDEKRELLFLLPESSSQITFQMLEGVRNDSDH